MPILEYASWYFWVVCGKWRVPPTICPSARVHSHPDKKPDPRGFVRRPPGTSAHPEPLPSGFAAPLPRPGVRYFPLYNSGSLASLFAVCPVLEYLEIDGLADVHFLPLTSQMPTHLKSLTLRSTGSYASDIMRYVHAWAPANPSLVRILLHLEVLPADASPMFAGAETLVVTQHAGQGSPTIETTRSDGRKFTLVRRGGWSAKVNYDVLSATLAGIIRPHAALLGALRVLRAPVTVLDALLLPEPAPAPALPALRELTVFVQMWIPRHQSLVDHLVYGDPDPVFPASMLSCLRALGQSPLALIEVVVGTAGRHALADENVRDVLETLADSLPPRDQIETVHVVLKGFQDGGRLAADALPRVHGYLIDVGDEAGNR